MFEFTILRVCPKRILWTSVALTLAACGQVAADDIPRSNLVLVPVQSFSGTVESVPLPSAYGEDLETGPITLSIDPDATNVFGLDNYQHQGVIDVTLLLSAPLFSELRQTPRIRIIESGPAYVEDPRESGLGYDFLFHALLTGGGTVENGLFAGTVFHNVNAYEGEGVLGSWIVRPGSTVTWDIQGQGSVTFPDPDHTTVTDLGGSGFLTTALPEPSSLTLGGIGAVAIIAFLVGFRKSQRKSRSTVAKVVVSP